VGGGREVAGSGSRKDGGRGEVGGRGEGEMGEVGVRERRGRRRGGSEG